MHRLPDTLNITSCFLSEEMVRAILRFDLTLLQVLESHLDAYRNKKVGLWVDDAQNLIVYSSCNVCGKQVETQTRVSDGQTFVFLVTESSVPCLADDDTLPELGRVYVSPEVVDRLLTGRLLADYHDFLIHILPRHGNREERFAPNAIESHIWLNKDDLYISRHTLDEGETTVFVVTRLTDPELLTAVLMQEEYMPLMQQGREQELWSRFAQWGRPIFPMHTTKIEGD